METSGLAMSRLMNAGGAGGVGGGAEGPSYGGGGSSTGPGFSAGMLKVVLRMALVQTPQLF